LLIALGSSSRASGELERQAAQLASLLAEACPFSGYADSKALAACASMLRKTSGLPFAAEILWGDDQPELRIRTRP
jgi:hypothetical protein